MAYQKVAPQDSPPSTETARVLVNGPVPDTSFLEDASSLSDTATLIRAGAQAVQGVRQSVRKISNKLGPLT